MNKIYNIERSIKSIVEYVRDGVAVLADFHKGTCSPIPRSDLSGFYPYIFEAGGVLSDGSNVEEDVRSLRAASDGDPRIPYENILICQEDHCAGPVMAVTQTENGCAFKSFVFGDAVSDDYSLTGEIEVIECTSGEYTGHDIIFNEQRNEFNYYHQHQAEILMRAFILMVNTKNIEVDVEERSPQVQKSRQKHRKPPLPAYRRIRVGSVKKVIAKATGEKHSKKSAHYRSGGWCYRKTGTRYWRKPCKIHGGGKNIPKYYMEYLKNNQEKNVNGKKKSAHSISPETSPSA